MSKCNCFSNTLDRMKDRVIEEMPKDAINLEIDWKGSALFFSGDHVPVNPKIAYSYRDMKKDGTPKANRTKGEVSILCNYCPLCGRKLGEDKGDDHE